MKMTPAEQRLLRALAELGGGRPVPAVELATYLGKESADVISGTRRDLLRKGWLLPPRGPNRGLVAFATAERYAFIAGELG